MIPYIPLQFAAAPPPAPYATDAAPVTIVPATSRSE
jgi:hypothetical protein